MKNNKNMKKKKIKPQLNFEITYLNEPSPLAIENLNKKLDLIIKNKLKSQ
jgi:hypothetical protein